MTNLLAILTAVGLVLSAASASAQGQIRIIPARATMLADTQAIAPGQTFTVGVLITIEPGWHVYWINPGEAGLATSVRLNLPQGFTAGPIQFPTPIRFMQSEEVVGYGYIGQVMLLAAITAPQTLPAGPITLGAEASWLCCKEFCLPGKDKLELKLPVADAPKPANREQFEHWKDRLPQPAGQSSAGELTVQSEDKGKFLVTVQWKQPPDEVRFFPAPGEALRVSDISMNTEGSTTRIGFHAQILPGETLQKKILPFVVAYHQGDEPWRGIEAQVPLTKLTNPNSPAQ